jgi:hypothetical protein
MKDTLAEKLLAEVMDWQADDVANERPYLQDIATYKYDEYQQFAPGIRFIESLARWLNQFNTHSEKQIAYNFVKNRLIFISKKELEHLAATAYPDHIRFKILKQVATDNNVPAYRVAKIIHSKEFALLRRQSLFLGLSDGAHTDIIRRSNSVDLTHEQVYQTYEITKERANNMLEKLHSDLKVILGREPTTDECRFKMVFLLDDFSGSGKSYLRLENDKYKGKIANFHNEVTNLESPFLKLFDINQMHVYIILYICTKQAFKHLDDHLKKFWHGPIPPPDIDVLLMLRNNLRLNDEKDREFLSLCKNDNYYDAKKLEDEHTRIGSKHVKYGFGNCHLPIVLAHNSTNNSVALLWAYEDAKFHGLFPRVPRHK